MTQNEILNNEILDRIINDGYKSDEVLNAIEFLGKAYNRLHEIHFEAQRCYIGESPERGRGVFAKCDISAGNVITMVPIHFLVIHHKNRAFTCPNSDLDIYNTGRRWRVDGKFIICSDRNVFDNPFQLGHMVNDFSRPKSSLFTDALEYLDQSETGNNSKPQAHNFQTDFDTGSITLPIILIIATKDIKMGEEILLSHGI